jgi:tetratricopeptide (TPR) repeat protein
MMILRATAIWCVLTALILASGCTCLRRSARGEKRDYDRTILGFTKAIELNPDYAKAYHNRAVAYSYNQDYDKAWADVKMCRKLGMQVHARFIKDLQKASDQME